MHADAGRENAPRPRPATVAYVGASLDGFLARPDGDLSWRLADVVLLNKRVARAASRRRRRGWSGFVA